mgnify:CR=1 FL=1
MAESAPPESLLNFEAPLFVGENSKDSTKPVPESQGSASQVDEIINSMLPPREWTEESGNWMQYTAKSPATRLDVINVQEHLDRKLQEGLRTLAQGIESPPPPAPQDGIADGTTDATKGGRKEAGRPEFELSPWGQFKS